ncbi:hypothetical protein A2Z33_07265 [Candidatus Gottesmanbacteria bacterium RBG_16_52_11]|uniref:Glycosyltransferase RgtA/B/C/D-like domain-containing protein n=1 Tax=Candidatus Gottesmanbacteria bacterium RBG_16_52_11 TaxID=1798374 RepID=A0A1F5YXZ9_9BACT|nr:MAG: hypothetical protein A2Z33_07265 [Candidatus Gottesmanbacteria bacterium RBG_16_52_11]
MHRKAIIGLPGIAIIILAALLYFTHLGLKPFERWDEITNVQVVRETILSKNRILLTLNGSAFFEKPPLWYWLSQFPVYLTGIRPESLRFVSAASGILTVWLTYRILAAAGMTTAGILSALTLLAVRHLSVNNPGGFFSTHTFRSADVDGLFTMLTVASWYALMRYGKNRHGSIIAGILTGLGLLTKGPLILVGILPYFIFRIISKYHEKILTGLFLTLGTAVIVAAPWHSAMIMVYGRDFLTEYFGYHMLYRIIQPLEGHYAPLYFPLQILTHPAVNPFFAFGALALGWSVFTGRIRKDALLFTATLSILIIIVTAMIVRTKLAWYILPIYPFTAVITGYFLNYCIGLFRTAGRTVIRYIAAFVVCSWALVTGYSLTAIFLNLISGR